MHEGHIVIDATIHSFNFMPENAVADFVPELTTMLYNGATTLMSPPDDPRYKVTWDEFCQGFRYEPERTLSAMFRESETDICVYHGVPMEGLYVDGSSPIWVAKEIKKLHPDRMHIYGPLYPWRPDAIDELERMVAEDQIMGLKFYPVDLYQGELQPSFMNTDAAFDVVHRAAELGLDMIAIHKAVPLGPLPLEPFYGVGDLAPLFSAFPDMKFEIVHGGVAFLPETAALYARYDNVYINLEGAAAFSIQLHDDLRNILRTFIDAGGHERILYATGAVGMHPQPVIEAFWDFELEGLTDEMKADMMGRNYARAVGWDLDALTATLADDEFGLERELAEPWSVLAEHRGGT